MENLTNYYNEVIEIFCSKAIEVFNNNYNLNINKDNILNNLWKMTTNHQFTKCRNLV